MTVNILIAILWLLVSLYVIVATAFWYLESERLNREKYMNLMLRDKNRIYIAEIARLRAENAQLKFRNYSKQTEVQK